MVERVLIDTLNFKAKILSQRWRELIRDTPELRHYNMLDDAYLERISEGTFPQLARYIERGLDRSILGDFFLGMGRNSVQHGFPLAETVYGLRLSQKLILEYMESEFVLDNPVALYQALSVIPKVADFFLSGCFYLNKGFQEATIERMVANEKISRDTVTKYFKEDFFLE